MKLSLSKRNIVRFISFMLAVLLIGFAGMLNYRKQSKDARLLLEYQYINNIENLTFYLSNIKNSLTKAGFTSTAEAMEDIGSDIYFQASFAKDALTGLPIDYLNLENTYKFLAQVGDYSLSVTKSEEITNEDRINLEMLNEYCDTLLNHMFIVTDAVNSGELSFESIHDEFTVNEQIEQTSANITDGFTEFEDGFATYPTLIYDGPFSDHIMQKEPEHIKGKEEVTQDEAREIAAKALGVPSETLQDDDDEMSNMESFAFMDEDKNITVTKAGGVVGYHIRDRQVSESVINLETAIEKAKTFMKNMGITNITETYHESANNIVTINFAATQDDIVLYTDLIKVSVALDNGEVLRYDARGFITNHYERTGLVANVTKGQAEEVLSDVLTVDSSKLCLIPSAGLNEVLTYEFNCTANSGENVLVYINAKTLAEEQLLIVYKDDNAMLAM